MNDVESRLTRLYGALETGRIDLNDIAPSYLPPVISPPSRLELLTLDLSPKSRPGFNVITIEQKLIRYSPINKKGGSLSIV